MLASVNPFIKLEQRRRELGISKTAVARRSGISLNTVKRILSGQEKRPALANLDSIAKSLGVSLRLGASQEVDVHGWRKLQAERKARKIVRLIQGTMVLEAQAVDPNMLDQMVERTVAELLAGPNRRLWDE